SVRSMNLHRTTAAALTTSPGRERAALVGIPAYVVSFRPSFFALTGSTDEIGQATGAERLQYCALGSKTCDLHLERGTEGSNPLSHANHLPSGRESWRTS